MTESAYYEQNCLWGQAPESYQLQVRADLLSLLPADAQSILDVGCGDGFLTHALPADRSIIGLDLSLAALRHLRTRGVAGSIEALPFTERSFDLVMANDVLEHLNDDAMVRALAELARVSRGWLLCTVPLLEQLEVSFTRCQRCGTVHHINHHQRSFTESFLVNAIPAPFRVVEIRYSGGYTPPPDATIRLRHGLSRYRFWSGTVCPRCGEQGEAAKRDAVGESLDRLLDGLCAKSWWGGVPRNPPRVDRSELIVLCHRQSDRVALMPASRPTQTGDLLEADFSNPLREVKDWTAGLPWTRYRLHHLARETSGVTTPPSPEGTPWIEIRLPTVARPGDLLELETTGSDVPCEIAVAAWDTALQRERVLALVSIPLGRKSHTVRIDRNFSADLFGLAINLAIRGSATLHRLRFQPAEGSRSVPLVQLERGHNVLAILAGNYVRSWGLWVEEGGTWPAPNWLEHAQESRPDPEVHTPWEHLAVQASEVLGDWSVMAGDLESALRERVAAWSAATDRIQSAEQAARAAEQAARAAEQAARAAEQTASAAEQAARAAEQTASVAQARAKSEEERRVRAATRRVQRVLVLSHMFPHREQPGLGSFVLEQVQALRREEDIDARVVCCLPFWASTLRPRRLLRALGTHRRQLRELKWQERDGVPVIYPSYLVGGVFRLVFHAMSYRASVMVLAERLWSEFRFDLIHAHTGYLDGMAGAALANRFGVPLVITEHTGPLSQLVGRVGMRAQTIRGWSRADRLICVSGALAREVRTYLPKERHSRLQILHNGVDPQRFTTPERWVRDPMAPRLIAIGSLDDNKDPLLLLEAFARIRQKARAATLKIVGQGPLRNEIETRAAALGIASAVHLTGQVSRDEVARLLREECDLLVLSSHVETFGVVVIEALASGKPVVATRCGGPEDVLVDPALGALCPPGDVGALAAAIEEVVDRLPVMEPMTIRSEALSRFGYSQIARVLAETYQEVAAERAGPLGSTGISVGF